MQNLAFQQMFKFLFVRSSGFFTQMRMFLVVTVFATACSSKWNAEVFLEAPKNCETDQSAQLALLEHETFKISVPADCLPEYYKRQTVGKCLLVGLQANRPKLDVFDFCTAEYIKSIQYDKNFIKNAIAFHFHNMDSIFLIEEDPPAKLWLLNGDGSITDSWVIADPPINWTLPKGANKGVPLYYFSDMGPGVPINHFDPEKMEIHLTVTIPDAFCFRGREAFKYHGIYGLGSGEWVSFFGLMPGIYSADNAFEHKLPDYFTLPAFCLVNGDTSYVSFPADHHVYLFDNRKGLLLDKKCASGNVKLSPPIPFEDELQDEINYMIEAAVYGGVCWHSEAKIFSRMLLHSQPLYWPDGKLRRFESKNVSILLFDSAFRKIGEHLFTPSDRYSGTGGSSTVIKPLGLPHGLLASIRKDSLQNDEHLVYQAVLGFTSNVAASP